MDQFLQENLAFPYDSFDGALVWDSLQFLSPHLLQITVDRLFDTLRPDSYLLAFFHADEKAKQIPLYNYRIADQKTSAASSREDGRIAASSSTIEPSKNCSIATNQ